MNISFRCLIRSLVEGPKRSRYDCQSFPCHIHTVGMNLHVLVLSLVAASLLQCLVYGFRSPVSRKHPSTLLRMGKIAEGVEFNTIAREWRLKFDTKNDKKSLVSVQQTLNLFKSQLLKISGVKSVQRIVCGVASILR